MVMLSQNVLVRRSTHIKGDIRARNLWLEVQQQSWNVGNSVQQVRTLSLFIILFLADSLSGHMIGPADAFLSYRSILQWCIYREKNLFLFLCWIRIIWSSSATSGLTCDFGHRYSLILVVICIRQKKQA